MTIVALTDSAVRNIKRSLKERFPAEKSSHLTEALAAACGFKSQAALLNALRSSDVRRPNYVQLQGEQFLGRLKDMNPDTALMPGFSFESLKYAGALEGQKTSDAYARNIRQRAWRNMMVAAINEGLRIGLYSVLPGDNRWPGYDRAARRQEEFIYRFSVDGIPVVASVRDAGFDELSIHVAFWPGEEAERWVPVAMAGFSAGEAFASGWLERRDGAWLQITKNLGSSFQSRKHRLGVIAKISLSPEGYSDNGAFRL